MGADEYVPCHSADTDQDWQITAVELGRVVGFYNAAAYHVNAATLDGYAPGYHPDPTSDPGFLPSNRTTARREEQTVRQEG